MNPTQSAQHAPTQSNPNTPHYNACLIEVIERIQAGRFSTLDEIEKTADDMPGAWRDHLIADAIDAVAALSAAK